MSLEERKPTFQMPSLAPPSFPESVVDIRDFGAKDGGKESNTETFRAAISKCAAKGGGTVRVPQGVWLTGPIHLRSNIRLHLEAGATLRFSTRPAEYLPVVFTRWEGVECYNYSPLIYAIDCSNIALTGKGILDGQGAAWWHWKRKNLSDGAAKRLYGAEHDGIGLEDRVFGREEDALRPQFFQPIRCSNVLIEGVTFINSPMWTIHPVYCQDVIVRNVTVLNDAGGANTDGLNPDSCRNVLIEHCRFSTGDDCIAINSGMNEDGWRVGRPCENILIRHCRMEKGHGGVVIGSAMSGGVRNVYAHDCRCEGTDIGIRLKSMRGRGGIVENVCFDNFQMAKIVYDAVRITTFYGASSAVPKSDKPPTFRNISMSNISCDGAEQAVMLRGLPEQPLENIVIKDLTAKAQKGISCDCVDNLTLENVSVNIENSSSA